MFLDRRSDRSTRHLEWRVRIFGTGAILALAGMYADIGWMVWAAVAVLASAFLLRFAGGEGLEGADEDGGGEEEGRPKP